MRATNRFGRNTPTYNCNVCGRRTRETGEGESDCQLCVDCWTIAGEDNHHNDNGTKPDAAQRKELDVLLAHIASKGGDVEEVKRCNTFVFSKGQV